MIESLHSTNATYAASRILSIMYRWSIKKGLGWNGQSNGKTARSCFSPKETKE